MFLTVRNGSPCLERSPRPELCDPVGGPVDSTGKARGIDHGFDPMDRMAVQGEPVVGQPPAGHPQQMRGQMGHPYPVGNQKAGVVGKQVEVLPSRLVVPADEGVAGRETIGDGGEGQAGDGPVLGHGNILQVFAHWLAVAEIMMVFNEAVEDGLLRSTADLAQNDGPEISQRAGQRRFVHARRRWSPRMPGLRSMFGARGRKFDKSPARGVGAGAPGRSCP